MRSLERLAAFVAIGLGLVACRGESRVEAAATETGAASFDAVASRPYELAVHHANAGEAEAALETLQWALDGEAESCQRALLDAAFATLRDRDEFRRAITQAAIKHAIHELRLAPIDEPGEAITVRARVVDSKGQPVEGAHVRVFATDELGRYHPTIEGERVPRIFGSLASDARGEVVFHTVMPGPYPGTRNARHVHISVRKDELRLAAPQYAVFDDDPLLAEPQNAEQRGEALRIAMQTVDGRRIGRIDLPVR